MLAVPVELIDDSYHICLFVQNNERKYVASYTIAQKMGMLVVKGRHKKNIRKKIIKGRFSNNVFCL